MKKKIIIIVASLVSLALIIVGSICIYMNLNPTIVDKSNVITADNIISKYESTEKEKNAKCDGYDITYSNVYSYGGYFIFKDEGYIIINTKNMMQLKINKNDFVRVYELDNNKEMYEPVRLAEEYGVDYNLQTYLVMSSKYYKIVFDSIDPNAEYNAGNIILS